jgi:hypothetical protein
MIKLDVLSVAIAVFLLVAAIVAINASSLVSAKAAVAFLCAAAITAGALTVLQAPAATAGLLAACVAAVLALGMGVPAILCKVLPEQKDLCGGCDPNGERWTRALAYAAVGAVSALAAYALVGSRLGGRVGA